MEDVLVLEGQANVAAGDVVAAGDILISGNSISEPSPYMVSDPEKGPQVSMPYTVRARGQGKRPGCGTKVTGNVPWCRRK